MKCPPLGICARGVVARVIDGDTLIFALWGAIPIRIRLLDCWAAETTRAKSDKERDFGQRAKEFLQSLAEGEQAILSIQTADADDVGDLLTLDRVLGHVWLKSNRSMSLSETMRAAGLAFLSKADLDAAVAKL